MRRFTLFPYFGGKFYLVNRLKVLFPAHKTYVEPFCGSAVILLNKEPSFQEVINDKNDEIINLFTVVKNKPEAFYESFRYTFSSRTFFNNLVQLDPSTLTDVQRAFRFFYLQRHVINCIPGRYSFRTSRDSKQTINYNSLKKLIDTIYERIKNVKIENLDFREIFRCYDHKSNFFYLDPPYHEVRHSQGKKCEYTYAFTYKDFEALRDCCKNMHGKFLMSLNNTKYVRELFSDFIIRSIHHQWGTKSRTGSDNSVTELLISNYDARVKRFKLKIRE